MKIFRFMSKLEFYKYMNRETLTNVKDHSETNVTNSIGFCFLDYYEYNPEYAGHFLLGICDLDVCAVFETNNEMLHSTGLYAKPISIQEYEDLKKIYNPKSLIDFEEFAIATSKEMYVNEYSITSYNKENMKLIKYCDDIKLDYHNLDSHNWKWAENK